MLVGVFFIALIFIILLAALPFIFKCIFKTQNYMGLSIGLCASALTVASITGVAIVGSVIIGLCLGFSIDNYKSNNSKGIALAIGALLAIFVMIILIYIVIFLFIFFYTKGISNPNQPYNSVFMFIAGYFIPLFGLIYFGFILSSINYKDNYNYGRFQEIPSGFLILSEFFFLLYMIQISGTIMLCMLHHRKVNQYILCILLGCYFIPVFSFLTGLFSNNDYLLLIPNMVLNLAPFGFGIFFYCKYSNQDYPKSELLAPSDI